MYSFVIFRTLWNDLSHLLEGERPIMEKFLKIKVCVGQSFMHLGQSGKAKSCLGICSKMCLTCVPPPGEDTQISREWLHQFCLYGVGCDPRGALYNI